MEHYRVTFLLLLCATLGIANTVLAQSTAEPAESNAASSKAPTDPKSILLQGIAAEPAKNTESEKTGRVSDGETSQPEKAEDKPAKEAVKESGEPDTAPNN